MLTRILLYLSVAAAAFNASTSTTSTYSTELGSLGSCDYYAYLIAGDGETRFKLLDLETGVMTGVAEGSNGIGKHYLNGIGFDVASGCVWGSSTNGKNSSTMFALGYDANKKVDIRSFAAKDQSGQDIPFLVTADIFNVGGRNATEPGYYLGRTQDVNGSWAFYSTRLSSTEGPSGGEFIMQRMDVSGTSAAVNIGGDFAFHPHSTDLNSATFYSLGTNGQLRRGIVDFIKNTIAFDIIGTARLSTGIPLTGQFLAEFFDEDGTLWVYSSIGQLHIVPIPDLNNDKAGLDSASFFSKTDPLSWLDGARCPFAKAINPPQKWTTTTTTTAAPTTTTTTTTAATTIEPTPTTAATTIEPTPTTAATTIEPTSTTAATTTEPTTTTAATTIEPTTTTAATTIEPTSTTAATTIEPTTTTAATTIEPTPTTAATTIEPTTTTAATTIEPTATTAATTTEATTTTAATTIEPTTTTAATTIEPTTTTAATTTDAPATDSPTTTTAGGNQGLVTTEPENTTTAGIIAPPPTHTPASTQTPDYTTTTEDDDIAIIVGSAVAGVVAVGGAVGAALMAKGVIPGMGRTKAASALEDVDLNTNEVEREFYNDVKPDMFA